MRVNIVGKSKTWVDAPYEGEVWGITQLLLQRPCDLVIDMNVYDDGRWGEEEKWEADVVFKLCDINGIPHINLNNYPYQEISNKYKTDYFGSTLDYAIALALFRGYDDIHIYGATLAYEGDYYKLKCGVDFWCGYAKGLGVNLEVHGETVIMKTVDGLVYGYDIKQRVG